VLDDSALRAELGRFGLARVTAELSWARSKEQLLRAYDRALELGGR
jgi:glycosyltransferase involved in cell wall biosynthesis